MLHADIIRANDTRLTTHLRAYTHNYAKIIALIKPATPQYYHNHHYHHYRHHHPDFLPTDLTPRSCLMLTGLGHCVDHLHYGDIKTACSCQSLVVQCHAYASGWGPIQSPDQCV
ncbi:uncharacterized protein BO66DRAFT_120198 [Aspergillus aculeatinus CBS 121060]|uniref:Uncharacterized protein n=1 Tax=Aspergillus aculeatinus CBS 121060 TaxID=1448322 RepID=A0ACD1H6I3_9EURO|nr:hypothetical protein BO66DRAFT_120198 [Aspergillus aculeatinus CBS 121060]RAH69021.1 hypothetical protein BO66DRAFT_120198 [Aspergillus aculeatinus CBS 121060]